ncbi:MAG: LysE family translocator [Jannaschia sp.]
MIAILAAFALVTVAPGPANLAVSLLALGQGQRAAIRMAVGLATGLAVWGAAAALGLGAVLAASETAMTAMRVLGGAYLIWLAWSGLRSAGRATDLPVAHRDPFRAGLLLNLSNPKAVLAWLAALSMGLDGGTDVAFVILATGACAMIGLANYLFWALLMSRGGPRRFYARARRGIETTAAALFGLAGAELIRQGVTR